MKHILVASALIGIVGAPCPIRAAPLVHLRSTPATVHRGVLSPLFAPVLHITSGQTVEIDTISHGGLTDDPVKFFAQGGIPADQVLPDVVAVSRVPKTSGFGGHVLTGPIYVDGAEPGDMLEIRILKIASRVDYGVNNAGSGGAAPGMLSTDGTKIIRYDPTTRTVDFAPGIHFPMRPFMGIMAVAPPKPISSRPPGLYGGNMDFEKLQAGATLYLPVLVKGALFVTGDPHAAQGDGEVSGNAIEASNTPTLQFILHKGAGKAMTAPMAEDAANFYILGMDPDLNKALAVTIRNTVAFLHNRFGLSPEDGYSLCSTGIDFGIAEAVDQNLVVYATVRKSMFRRTFPYWTRATRR
jgi:acetamidase/formamidase